MAISAADIYTRVLSHFPEVDQDSFVSLLNEADVDIQIDMQLVPSPVATVNLVALQAQYDFPDGWTRVWSAYYVTSANSMVPIKETSIAELDYTEEAWRTVQQGTPAKVYDNGNKLGFFPPPNITTSGGNPCVQFWNTPIGGGYDINSSLPGLVPLMNAWVYAVCFKWAIMWHPDRVPMFDTLAQREKNRMLRYMYGRMARNKASAKQRYRMPGMV